MEQRDYSRNFYFDQSVIAMRLFQPRKQSYYSGLSAIDTAITPSFLLLTIFCHPEARRIFYGKILHCVQNDNCRFCPLRRLASAHRYNTVVIPAQAGTLKRSLCCCPLHYLASAHRRRWGSFFSLDRKETKDQGLHPFL